MAQAVSRRPVATEARIRSLVSPCEIDGGQNGTGIGFSPSTSVLSCQYYSTMAHTHLHLDVALTGRTNGRSLGIFQK